MTVVANTTPGLTHLSIGLTTAMPVRNIGAYMTKCQRAILSQLSGRGQRLQNVPKLGPRNETGGCRFLSKHMARNAARRDSADTLAHEWARYACRIPARGDRRFDRRVVCATLTEVYHVAHVPDACRIIEDGRIKAGLIGDESRLGRTRTSVCWLSANYWHPGSIYGTNGFPASRQGLERKTLLVPTHDPGLASNELVRTTLGYLLDELTEEEPLGPIKSARRRIKFVSTSSHPPRKNSGEAGDGREQGFQAQSGRPRAMPRFARPLARPRTGPRHRAATPRS
jgi:hypothetical protein